MSHVVQFVRTALHGAATDGGKSGHSWELVNDATARALSLAITARFRFEPDDMAAVLRSDSLRIPYGDEHYYSLACEYGNGSAARSFERMVGRKPFLVPWVPRRKALDSRKVCLTRAWVGRWFEWDDWTVKVTSFSDDGESLIACAYHDDETGRMPLDYGYRGPDRIQRRFTITRAELRAESVRRKAGGAS